MQEPDSIIQLQSYLTSSHVEPSPILARGLIKKAYNGACFLIEKGELLVEAALIASAAAAEQAQFEEQCEERLKLRQASIAICKRAVKKIHSTDLIIALANRIVDHFHDVYAREERPIMSASLSDVKLTINKQLSHESNANNRSLLFIQLSSILQCQAMMSAHEEKLKRMQEAVRCAERAIKEQNENPYAYLSHGQALWGYARLKDSDEDYYSTMNSAGDSLAKACNNLEALPALVLSRFYRQTYRPSLSVKMFKDYEIRESNRRRLLAESFIVGEAAMQLWYKNYDATTTQDAVDYAHTILREAIDAGYQNARIYVALALIQAAQGNIESSQLTLAVLGKEEISSWLDVIQKAVDAMQKNDIQTLTCAFALGIIDSAVWNSLGTYAYRFLSDPHLAVSLYETGKRLNPKNAIEQQRGQQRGRF